MGVCKKCKKRKTDLYCFQHKQNVCAACLAAGPAHARCHIGSYSDFLHLSEQEVAALLEAACPVCSQPLAADQQVFRLPCLHLVHAGCLEKRFGELPADTARAGFVCPQCQKPLFESTDAAKESPLATALEEQLRPLEWAAPLLRTLSSAPEESTQEPKQEEAPEKQEEASKGEEKAATQDTPAAAEATTPPQATKSPTPEKETNASSLFTSAAATTTKTPPSTPTKPHTHQAAPRPRNAVATGVPGVKLFVPPPPPKAQQQAPLPAGVLSGLPLAEGIDMPPQDDAEDLSLQMPVLGARLASRKGAAFDAEGRQVLYDDDDRDDKYHGNTLAFVLALLGITKRSRGRLVVDKKRVLAACVVALVVFALLVRIIVLSRGSRAGDEDAAADLTPRTPQDDKLVDLDDP